MNQYGPGNTIFLCVCVCVCVCVLGVVLGVGCWVLGVGCWVLCVWFFLFCLFVCLFVFFKKTCGTRLNVFFLPVGIINICFQYFSQQIQPPLRAPTACAFGRKKKTSLALKRGKRSELKRDGCIRRLQYFKIICFSL